MVEVKYVVNAKLNEEQVSKLWKFIEGPLVDLYGARTWLAKYSYGEYYAIYRINHFPLLPPVDCILEINPKDDRTEINCYLRKGKKHLKRRIKRKLEEICKGEVTIEEVSWEKVDLEGTLADYKRYPKQDL